MPVQVYDAVRKAGKEFELVFVSFDRNEASFKKYLGEMSWWALPFNDPRKEALEEAFDIEGIPTVVLLDEKGMPFSTDGVQLILGLGPDAFPWRDVVDDQ